VKASKEKPAFIKLIKPYCDKAEVETAAKLQLLSGEEINLDESGNYSTLHYPKIRENVKSKRWVIDIVIVY